MASVLILGGARSGKSARAMALAEAHTPRPIYIATAPRLDGDAEWRARIAHHRKTRGPHWRTLEEPLAVPETIAAHARPEAAIVVDCLTLWLFNLLSAGRDADAAINELCRAVGASSGLLLLVANEIGLGVVPEHPEARRFRDLHGRMNQRVAQAVDRVEFVAAGIPITLKGGNRG